MHNPISFDTIVSLCKRRGFIFPGSEIYGGLANTWDYGPLGVELKNNLKRLWWKHFVQQRRDVVGLDSAILMNPKIWEASGHLTNFSDPLMDCKACKSRERADKLVEQWIEKNPKKQDRPLHWVGEKTPAKDLFDFIHEQKIICPKCGKCDWTEPKQFNLMFKTHVGVTEESGTDIYMRPETAQGIFVNFKNVLTTSRQKIPFGIAQIGKAFRNEITPGNFIFRTREFEQMEIEYFVEEKDWEKKFEEWETECENFYDLLGIKKENIRWRNHEKDELSHYSKATKDIEYKFEFGWGELMGLAYRTNFDLTQHSTFSGEKLTYLDPTTGEDKGIPHVIEPSFGCDRTVLVILLDAYREEEAPTADGKTEKRVVMKFAKELAPIKVAILPLMKKPELTKVASDIFSNLTKNIVCEYDETGSIGKRYRRQDEIGTPYCVTIDYETLEDNAVTVRDRDTMEQKRVPVTDLKKHIENLF